METMGAVAAAAAPKSVLERIIGVFTSPRATMEDIAARPTWVLPLILVVVVSMASGYFLQDVIADNAIAQMQEKNQDIPAEQIEMTMKWTKISSWIAPMIATPIIYLVLAGVLMLAGSIILGGEAKFKSVFSIACWSGIITILSSLVNVPVMISRGVMESGTSLGALLPAEGDKTFINHLFEQIDLFYVWWVALLGFGVAAVYKFSTKKGMAVSFGLWGIFVVIAVILKSIFS